MLFSKSNHRNIRIALVILFVAGGLITFGAWSIMQRYQATNTAPATISTEVVTTSTDKPDETLPEKACTEYAVADRNPRKIEIPSLGTSGCIQRVGVDQHNAIAVPTNVHLAGWYINSALPGDKGVSIIDGHVSGRYSSALFSDIKKLQPGNTIKVQLGDYSWKEFEVKKVDNYPIDHAVKELLKNTEGIEHQLNLVTCGGTYNAQTKSYSERVIVRASLRQ